MAAEGASPALHADKLQEFLKCLSTAMPEDIRAQIGAAMQRRWDTPPLKDMSAVLHRNVTPDKARQILFYPDADDMALYFALLQSPPPGSPQDHPQAKLQIIALSVLFMVHCKKWERVKAFIESGCLRPLAAMLDNPNLYLAGQAMETILK